MKKILNLSKILSAITITLLLSSNNISLAMFNYLNVDRDLKPVPSAQVRPDGTVDPYGIVNRGDGNLYYVDASGAEQSLPFYEQLTPSGRPQLTAAGRAFFNKQPIPVEAPVASVPEIIADSVPEADVVAPTISDVADTAPEVVTEEPRKLPDNVNFDNVNFDDISAAVDGDQAANARVMDSFLGRHSEAPAASGPSDDAKAAEEARQAVVAQEQADREAAEARAAKYEADQQAENELLAKAMAEGQKLQKLEAQAKADREAHDAKIAQDRADHEAAEARAVQAKADQEAEKSQLAEALELGQKLETLEAKSKADQEATEAVVAQQSADVEATEAVTAAAAVVSDPVTDGSVTPPAPTDAGGISMEEAGLTPEDLRPGWQNTLYGWKDKAQKKWGELTTPAPIIKDVPVDPEHGSTMEQLGVISEDLKPGWQRTLSNWGRQARDKVYGWKYQGEQARDKFVADTIDPKSNSYGARAYRGYGDARSYGSGLYDETQEHGYMQTARNIIDRTRNAETRRTGDVAVIAGATAAAAAATYGVYKAYKWLTRKAEANPGDAEAQAAAQAAKALVQEEARKAKAEAATSLRSSQNDKLRELSKQSARLRSSLRSGSRARAL